MLLLFFIKFSEVHEIELELIMIDLIYHRFNVKNKYHIEICLKS
jgi:hypothetical protein